MRRLLTGVLVSTLIMSTSLSASAAPWVRKAVVDGDYGGHYRRTECTYSECSKRTAAYRLGWLFTPVERGIRMTAVAQDYRMVLRWVPGGGYYVGTNMAEPGRARRITIHVSRQTQIEGVWTARKLVGTLRTWLTDAPRYYDEGTVVLVLE
ncbi:MAG: hypothetical protein ACXWZU_04200 [Actinomycetota bacterium]